ncbi:uncharacterized protein LOC131674114 [Phymastichus coffea]|uniref:uncharacterized protein LOC131674114 n=1 Tax=Phymastichus coffea TaxID=108790 RepID=UPI00273BB1CD|nr:uncharacterized protein LOC131674114 [Phymastichus coffea]
MSSGGEKGELARALLDPCSEATLISLDLVRRLGCQLRRTNTSITGVTGPAMDSARHQATVYIVEPSGGPLIKTGAFVLRSLGIITPSAMPGSKLSLLKRKLLLADPTFHRPGRIDVVIGADVYHRIIRTGTRRFGQLVAQNTSFGWTVMGSAHSKQASDVRQSIQTHAVSARATSDLSHEELLALVQRFWALEEVPVARRISKADQECEAIYARGVRRETSGRYVIRLPLKPEYAASLGDSLLHARSTLFSMQRRMLADQTLRESYQEFMEEYIRLDHMRLLSESELQENRSTIYYVPHHGIWQRSDSGPKLRVVFNAS